MPAKPFPIENVLSLTAGVWIARTGSTSHVGDILRHATGCLDMCWNQYSRCADEIGDKIRAQLPKDAQSLTADEMDAMIERFMDSHGSGVQDALISHLQEKFGKTVEISPVDGYQHDDPQSEYLDQILEFNIG
jgi:hypothetical protein